MSNRWSWVAPAVALCVIGCTRDESPSVLANGALPGCTLKGTDEDHDKHFAICRDFDGKLHGDDCDDHDARRHPGAEELCDDADLDEDCDPKTFGDLDRDGDGFFDARCCNRDAKGKRSCGDDCYDFAAEVHPGAVELCDHYDNDCNGSTDEHVLVTRYIDEDHDGHGAIGGKTIKVCPDDVAGALKDDDCDDTDALVYPGMPEICDDKDNDCDGKPERAGEAQAIVWYLDADQDGFGVTSAPAAVSCSPPPFPLVCPAGAGPELCAAGDAAKYVAPTTQYFAHRAGDCDDNDPHRFPGAAERCNGVDDDCNGRADFAIGNNDFEDDDHDTFPDKACKQDVADCNDRQPTMNPEQKEICDRLDNDCDGNIDEDVKLTAYYPDRDGDGYGDSDRQPLMSCVQESGYAPNGDDCDDHDPARNPGSTELCNTRDEDCDGKSDENLNACGQAGLVSGRVVRSEDGAIVKNARVSVYDAYGTLLDSGPSSASGLFSLAAPSGAVLVAVEAPAGTDLVGLVRGILAPATDLVARLDSASRWNAIARADGVTRDPQRGLFVAEMVGPRPAGGQSVLLGPGGGEVVSRVGTATVYDARLPAFTPPVLGPAGQPLANVTHYNLPAGMQNAMLSEVANCRAYLVDNLDTGMPAATQPIEPIAFPIITNSVTFLRVDCSADLGTCCTAHGQKGCSDKVIESCVCARQRSCCDNAWDDACGALVTTAACSMCARVAPDGGPCCSTSTSGGCNIDEVAQCVCAARPQCCTGAWDQDCVSIVTSLHCGVCVSAPGAGIGP